MATPPKVLGGLDGLPEWRVNKKINKAMKSSAAEERATKVAILGLAVALELRKRRVGFPGVP
jgi:hypothetical protein